jgi:hypothetical protein
MADRARLAAHSAAMNKKPEALVEVLENPFD